MTQLKQSYHDLKRATLITNKTTDESNKPDLLCSVYLLEQNINSNTYQVSADVA